MRIERGVRALDRHMFVAGQVHPEDIADLAVAGIRLVINNRPDGEEPGQPSAAELALAAEQAGLEYRHIPVAAGFSQAQVNAMGEALSEASGPVLAFCRSGTRSTFLWALAEASRGVAGDELIAKAAEAGYDLGPIAGHLTRTGFTRRGSAPLWPR